MRTGYSILILLLVGVSFPLPASAEAAQEKDMKAKTVDWYMASENKAALEAKLSECRNNPGELGDTPDCENALTAESKFFARKPASKVKW